MALTDQLLVGIELLPDFNECLGFDGRTASAYVVGVALSILVVGPVEEFLFRGVFQGRLREAFPPMLAIGLAGLVFAFFHLYLILVFLPSVGVVVHLVAYYTTMGAVFGFVYERTGTLIAPALTHGVFNAILFGWMIGVI